MLVDELLGIEDRPENIFPGFLTIGTRGDIGENDRNSNPYKGPHTPMHVMNSPPESILTEVQNAIFSSDCSPELGSPWENGYVESFNGRLRDELLAREQLDTLLEAKVLIERWRRLYNTVITRLSASRPRGDPATSLRSGYASTK